VTGAEAAQGLARGFHVAGTVSIFGTTLFQTLIAFPVLIDAEAAAVPFRRGIVGLVWTSLAMSFLGGLAWLALQSVAFADSGSISDLLAAVSLILFDTHFGPLIGVRLILLLPACMIIGGKRERGKAWRIAAAILAASAIELQVLLGHGLSMQGGQRVLLVGAEVLHILSAGAWLGGLVPLLLLVRRLAPSDSVRAVNRFSTLGLACVTALGITSLLQAWLLVGGLPGLIGTDYGRLALAKLGLFLVLLLLAALNRFHLRPRLLQGDGKPARRRLAQSIIIEAALGFAVLLLAGMLLMLAPAIRQQVEWPFPWALRPDVLESEEARLPLLCIGLGIAFFAVGFLVRRVRVLTACAGGLLVGTAVALAGPLLTSAHPTSFYHSPTGFTAASIAHGRQLFAENCASCHHNDTTKLRSRSDGDLFWLLAHGTDAAPAMPGFRSKLMDRDLWSLIDFLKARADAWDGPDAMPEPAPDIPIAIDGRTIPLSRLRGRAFGLIATDQDGRVPTDSSGLHLAAIEPGSDGWTAYSVVASVDPDRLRYFAFLVDADGRLRGVFPPKENSRPDLAALDAAFIGLRK
jgi:putative copper export protein/mono/diheme cytochrome c family protein